MAEDLAQAISGEPPEEHYEIFQVIDVPPDSYLVEIYAYSPSLTVLMTLSNQEYEDYTSTMPEQDYEDDGNLTLVRYIVRLSPLQNFNGELVLPQTTDAWLDTFTFR